RPADAAGARARGRIDLRVVRRRVRAAPLAGAWSGVVVPAPRADRPGPGSARAAAVRRLRRGRRRRRDRAAAPALPADRVGGPLGAGAAAGAAAVSRRAVPRARPRPRRPPALAAAEPEPRVLRARRGPEARRRGRRAAAPPAAGAAARAHADRAP